jgi:AcrR family transcriptional regulator
MTPKQSARRSKRSHDAVLEAARELLAERGYANVTIEEIAARAGVGKTTIYRWWPAKASIFMELYTGLAAALQPLRDTGSLLGDLRAHLRGAFELLRTTIAGVALAGIVAEAQSNPDVARMLRSELAPSRRRVNRLILERAVERGEIDGSISLDLVADMITGIVWYCILVGRGPMDDALADEIVATIVQGIASGRGGAVEMPKRPRAGQAKGRLRATL